MQESLKRREKKPLLWFSLSSHLRHTNARSFKCPKAISLGSAYPGSFLGGTGSRRNELSLSWSSSARESPHECRETSQGSIRGPGVGIPKLTKHRQWDVVRYLYPRLLQLQQDILAAVLFLDVIDVQFIVFTKNDSVLKPRLEVDSFTSLPFCNLLVVVVKPGELFEFIRQIIDFQSHVAARDGNHLIWRICEWEWEQSSRGQSSSAAQALAWAVGQGRRKGFWLGSSEYGLHQRG